MRAKLVKIGNSRGVRLSKPILEASGLTDEIEIEVEQGRIVLLPVAAHPRAGWAEGLKKLPPDDEDWSDFEKIDLDFDLEEWTWPETDGKA